MNPINKLKEITNYKIIQLTDRGNTAIFAALYLARQTQLEGKEIVKKLVLIPDQGGWITYKKYPKMLGLEAREVKTDLGIIDLELLRNFIKKNKNISCILYTQPAAYYAEQPVEEIYKICKKNKVIVILDITGSIGSELQKTEYADIIIASFGKGKPVDLGYGGFIGIKDDFKGKEIFNTINFDEKYSKELLLKLNELKQRYEFFNKISEKIKNDLKGFEILHKKGINVIVKYKNNLEKEKIIDYCNKNKYEFVICPRDFKIKEKAISIEVKRL